MADQDTPDQPPADPRISVLLNRRQSRLNVGDDDGARAAESELAALGYDADGNKRKSAAEQRKAAGSDVPQGRTSKAGQTTAEGDKK